MKSSIQFFSFLVVILTACDIQMPPESGGRKVYLIKKGGHESIRIPKLFDADVLSFRAKFDRTAIYETRNIDNQADINQLLGFSDCNSHHQENSARFGWRWYNNRLEIHTYCYVNGNRIHEFMRSISIGETYDFKIEKVGNKYIFTIDSESTEVDKDPGCSGNLNYMLFPYFGGDETAPHDIRIFVDID